MITKGYTFTNGEVVTPEKLNDLVDDATIDDDSLTVAKLATGILGAQWALKTDTFAPGSLGAGGEADIPGLTVTVNVPKAGSKVVIVGSVALAGLYIGLLLKRDGTTLGLGDAAGSRTRVTFAGGDEGFNGSIIKQVPILWVDTPGSVGNKVYKLTMIQGFSSGSGTVNRPGTDDNANYTLRPTSQIGAFVLP